jgi:hypothetical protein
MPSAFSWPVLVPSALRAPAPVNSGVRPHMTTTEQFNRLSISVRDFEAAAAFAERAAATSPATLEHQALLFAAIVCYYRPFSPNERSQSAKADSSLRIGDFRTLNKAELEIHEVCKRLRNKALAHSEYEMNPTTLNESSGIISSRPFNLLAHAPEPTALGALASKVALLCHHMRADYIHHPGGGSSVA